VAPDGREVGTHCGLMYYTIGQRQGLGIGGPGEPWYVAGKDLQRNRLLVVQGRDHPALFGSVIHAQQTSWVGAPPIPGDYAGKTRYRQADAACTLSRADEGGCAVRFHSPQRAPTPGQSLVLYRGEVCLGGGVIATVVTPAARWPGTVPA
jgi:tRNA-specific 2-thiouridylase